MTFFLFLLISNSQNLLAIDIYGNIKENKTGEAVIGAVITLNYDSNNSSGQTTKPIKGAISNKFGFFSIPKVNPGTYLINVKIIGYLAYSSKIQIDEKINLPLKINLENQDISTGEVIVTAEKDKKAVNNISTVNIQPEFMAKMPRVLGEPDIFRALQYLPGVKASSEISSGLYVRGGSPDQNLILLDGVIVYNPSHLMGIFSTFNNDALRDVKLIKGAFPAEYGGRLSSVVDITMKEGTKEKISGQGGISLLASRLSLEGPVNENMTFMISGRRTYFDVIYNTFAPKDEQLTYYFYDLNAKINYKLSDNDRIFASGYFGQDVFATPSDSNSSAGINWGNSTLNIRWMHIVSPIFFTNFSFIYTDYSSNIEIADHHTNGSTMNSDFKFITKNKIRDFTLKGDAQYYFSEENKLKFGFEFTSHNFSATTLFSNIDITPDIIGLGTKEYNSLDLAAYAQQESDWSDKFSTNLGARLNYFQNSSTLSFEPRLSAAYKLTDKLNLVGSFAYGNQFLHLVVRNDITLPTDLWFPSTKNILPENSYQGVLGIQTSFMDGEYFLSIETYYKKMSNLLEYKDTATFTLGLPLENQFTSGTGQAYGLEFYLQKKLGKFTGWIGYTLAWTTRKFADLNDGKEFYPRYDRRHDISIVTTFELSKGWEIGATWIYGTGQAYTMPISSYNTITNTTNSPFGGSYIGSGGSGYQYSERNAYRLPSTQRLDLNLIDKTTVFGLESEIYLSIYNVYGHKNPFAWYIDDVYDGYTNDHKKVLKELTLFKYFASIGWNFKF